MDMVIGQTNSLATNKALPPSNGLDMAMVSSVAMDNRYQRLFVTDGIRVSRHESRNRVLVYDVSPENLTDHPEAIAVLGQPDFATNEPGLDASTLGGGSRVAINEEDSWLFAIDGTNNRVLVFDVSPDRLESGMEAIAVIGQQDFESNDPGVGATRLSRPAFVAYDPAYRRLFVTDAGNQRIVMYDIPRFEIGNGLPATMVLGQNNFETNTPRVDMRKAAPADLAIEPESQRMFVSEVGNNRILVFDIHPDRLLNNPDAINVIGQPNYDYTEFDPSVSINTTRSPHQLAIDSENQLAYMVDGFTGRNAISIFDIHPDRMEDQPDAIDVLGHLDDAGEPNFDMRAPQDVINGRFGAEMRSLVLDPVDHRLIAGDQYNHRVVIWQLDEDNRFQDLEADWVIGQPDLDSSFLRQRSAQNLKKPYALEYDTVHKRLFIAETLSDRVTIWNLDPEQMSNYPEAIGVIGQQDFNTRLPQRTRNGLFLGDSMNHGIGSAGTRPTGLAMDEENQRLFISDASNHRVMVFDVDPARFENHPDAILVLGQQDFTSGLGPAPGALSVDSTALTAAAQGSRAAQTTPEPRADNMFWPAALDYDDKYNRLFVNDGFNHRVLVFDANPDRLENGAAALAVIGQEDFSGNTPGMSSSKFQLPDGVAFDSVKDQLYVTDMGNDRVLVFDVNPETIENGADAVAVIGQTDFDTWHVGPEQDRLSDPRDIEFDSENQRLFVADSYQTRIVSYDMPSNSKTVDVPGFGSKKYSTLDWELSSRSESYTALSSPIDSLAAISVLSFTQQTMDPITERESRILLSEMALASSAPVQQALLYADSSDSTKLIINNPSQTSASLEINASAVSGDVIGGTIRRNVSAQEQLILDLSDLIDQDDSDNVVIELNSSVPVYVQGYSQDVGSEFPLASPAPIASSTMQGDTANIPRVQLGGGYQSEILLMNPGEEVLTGQIIVHGSKNGDLSDTYRIAPGRIYRWDSGIQSGLARTGYVTIHSDGNTVPSGGARISLYDDNTLVTRSFVPTGQVSRRLWVPVDNNPSTTRHGRINVNFNIVNNGAQAPAGASVRLNLFSPDGSFVQRFEQIIPIGEQWNISLVELAKSDRFRGSIRIASDVPVSVSATRVTENINGDLVEMELPIVDENTATVGRPLLLDGEGLASEIILLNTDQSEVEGNIEFYSANGDSTELILR
jgi:DNA-binding beta-propeller fold protein YncE